VRRECFLKRLKVLHPVEREIVWLRVDFVEDDYEGKLGLVEYAVGDALNTEHPK
jgi:hypothetical protein